MDLSFVKDGEICYYSKSVQDVFVFLQARKELFNTVYHHRVVNAVELMISDAIIEADTVLDGKYTKCLNPLDLEEYTKLTDDILYDIRYSNNEKLHNAQDIIKRIYNRDLYKYIDEVVISPIDYEENKITSDDLIDLISTSTYIDKDDIIIDISFYILKYS